MAIGFWPGGLEPAAAVCRLDADGGLTVHTGAVDMSGTATGFQTIAAAAFGVAPERVRIDAGDTAGRAVRGRERRQQDHLHGRARGRARGARRRASGCSTSPRTSSRSRPRTSRSSTTHVRPVGAPEPRAGARRARPRRSARLRQPARAGRGPRRASAQTSHAPSAAAHLSHVARRPRDRRRAPAAPRRRPGRRARAEPGARRGPDARRHGAGDRLGAARGDAATTTIGQLRTATLADYALPTRGRGAADRDGDRRGARPRRAVRGQGHRRGARGAPPRPPWPTRSRRRRACGCASCR